MCSEVTSADISAALVELGVTAGDTVLIHSSLKSFGHVVGGAQAVIDGVEAVLTKEGTLVMPTLSQVDFTNSYKTWYMDKPSDVGYLTEYFRKQLYVYRSNQATHSVAARGKLAYELTYEHTAYGPHLCPFGEYAFADSSPWMKLYRMNAKVLFFGVTMRSNTLKHVVESMVMEKLLGDVADEKTRFELKKRVTKFGDASPEGVWLFYNGDKMHEALEAKELVKKVRCGDAVLYATNAKDCCDAAYEMLMANPEEWYSGEKNKKKLDWINECKAAAKK